MKKTKKYTLVYLFGIIIFLIIAIMVYLTNPIRVIKSEIQNINNNIIKTDEQIYSITADIEKTEMELNTLKLQKEKFLVIKRALQNEIENKKKELKEELEKSIFKF